MKLSVSSKRTFALCLTMSILFIILLVYGIFATSGLSDTDFSSENAKDCKNSHLKQVHVVSKCVFIKVTCTFKPNNIQMFVYFHFFMCFS